MTTSSASAPLLSQPTQTATKAVLSPAKLAAKQNQQSQRSVYPVLEAKGYEVRETLGVGGYSKVKLAIFKKTGQQVNCVNSPRKFTTPALKLRCISSPPSGSRTSDLTIQWL